MKRFGGLSVAGLAALGILVTGAEAEEWFDTSASSPLNNRPFHQVDQAAASEGVFGGESR